MNEIDKTATLSIVIPVYNVSKYLILAVDSVLEQTVQADEIIIVNDGSTDDSGELAEKHYGHLSHVKIIHTQNQGLGEARNVGTRAATGDYIYYFDSDDLLFPGLVEDFFQVLQTEPDVDVFAFSAESFFDPLAETVEVPDKARLPVYRRAAESVFSTGEEAFNDLSLRQVFYPNAWLYVYARRVQVENQLFFQPIIHEDEEFTPRMFLVAGKTVVTDRIYFKRRVRPGSIMNTAHSEKNITGYLCSIDTLESLAMSAKNETTRSNLKQRIILNIINITLMKKSSDLQLSAETRRRYNAICDKHANFMSKVAGVNFFLYRVIRFGLRKIKQVAS
ncbi:glycosyltransferase [Erwiniaceae bacterium BAC15a-03b]|uniref:Glycosyltransferase n=1 Tax=Winslowiella arboricola TaxID=2978220 RepID=A0A9J6PT25_9GAMM|nr:glycosyltransferase [Winslowiella arboricola]MCU5774282.1 glycosyltransferase [Winslowiella arboricola]MCU5778829.1 glycosyltransferase [Winslowiella arboricola]